MATANAIFGKWNIDRDVLNLSKVGTFKWSIVSDKEELSGTWEIIDNILILDLGQSRKLRYEIIDASDNTIQIRLKQSNGSSISAILVGHKTI